MSHDIIEFAGPIVGATLATVAGLAAFAPLVAAFATPFIFYEHPTHAENTDE